MKNKERYLSTGINNDFYGKIIFDNEEPIQHLREEEFKEGEQGRILIPYIVVENTEKSSKQYRDFMESYRNQHKYCLFNR